MYCNNQCHNNELWLWVWLSVTRYSDCSCYYICKQWDLETGIVSSDTTEPLWKKETENVVESGNYACISFVPLGWKVKRSKTATRNSSRIEHLCFTDSLSHLLGIHYSRSRRMVMEVHFSYKQFHVLWERAYCRRRCVVHRRSRRTCTNFGFMETYHFWDQNFNWNVLRLISSKVRSSVARFILAPRASDHSGYPWEKLTLKMTQMFVEYYFIWLNNLRCGEIKYSFWCSLLPSLGLCNSKWSHYSPPFRYSHSPEDVNWLRKTFSGEKLWWWILRVPWQGQFMEQLSVLCKPWILYQGLCHYRPDCLAGIV